MTQTYSHDLETASGTVSVRAEQDSGEMIEITFRRRGLCAVFQMADADEAFELAEAINRAANSLVAARAAVST